MTNREVMQQTLEALENVNPSLVCEMAHHPKKDQHGIGQKCPLEIRHLETIAAIKEVLAQQPRPVQEQSCFCHDGVLVDYVKAQPEQEPVAWRVWSPDGTNVYQYTEDGDGEPLYTTPPQRPWLSLTGAEIDANEILRYHFSLNNGPVTRAGMAVVDAVTAMLKAKNHG
jgi:hypothetical protein